MDRIELKLAQLGAVERKRFIRNAAFIVGILVAGYAALMGAL